MWGNDTVKFVNVANWICLTAIPSLCPRANQGPAAARCISSGSLFARYTVNIRNISFGRVPSVPDLGQGQDLAFE